MTQASATIGVGSTTQKRGGSHASKPVYAFMPGCFQMRRPLVDASVRMDDKSSQRQSANVDSVARASGSRDALVVGNCATSECCPQRGNGSKSAVEDSAEQARGSV